MVCIQDDASSADQEEVKARLASLSSFQQKCLNHGLRFPRLKRLVYSTCSVHSQENEEVVVACLQQNPGFRSQQAVFTNQEYSTWSIGILFVINITLTETPCCLKDLSCPPNTLSGFKKPVSVGLFTECACVFSSRLVPLLPQWPERGQEPLTQCLRASVAKTRTHGFFVALLERKSGAENKEQEPVSKTR